MALEFDADEQELQLFLAENEEHLQLLDQSIIQLETTGDDPQLLQRIFRSAHTIKGSAGLIGHQRMMELAHGMENVLDALRAGTLPVTPGIVDALLAALDALRELNREVITRQPSPIVLDALREQLADCLHAKQLATEPLAPDSASTSSRGIWHDFDLHTDLPDGVEAHQLFAIHICIDPDCGLAAARTLQAYMELERTTHLLRAAPTLQQIEADETTNTLRVLVASGMAPSELDLHLSHLTDVLSVVVEPFKATATSDQQVEQPKQDTPVGPDPQIVVGQDSSLADTSITNPPEMSRGPSAPPARGVAVQQESSIRISVSIVDDLMSLVSELVLGRTRLQTLRHQLQERYRDDETVANLEDAVGHLDQVCNDLQTTVMKARMLPVENVFNKFPRLVRDLASQSGKHITFTMRGNETELDRSVIEQLSDPLVHLLRNALDHGVEAPQDRLAAGKPATGVITLSAAPCENHILIELQDDGRGIDGNKIKAAAVNKGLLSAEVADRLSEREAVELIFMPGLSTARAISDISGRGVGMDIVKAALERMGGHITINSTVGVGTTFSITLPLTLAIMQALLVSVENAVYALPLNLVTEILHVPADAIHRLQGTEATLLRGAILPLIHLRDYFGCTANRRPNDAFNIVATRVDGQLLGLVVDHFIGEQEIVMKPLGAYIGMVEGLAGATILGDGRIGLLVDVTALKHWAPRQPIVFPIAS